MPKYIDCEAANLALAEQGFDWDKAKQALASVPAADVAPVVHGKWEVIHIKNHWDKARCSACKRVFESYEWGSNYCPVCGAKMNGGVDNG